jgi:predicted patatin/cPLA2 family phospholipase
VRQSGIDFALVTFNISDMSSRILFKDDIPRGELADFVLARSNHPAFRRFTIDGDKYIDGGLYNNMPIRPLIDKGFENIIVVDTRDVVGMKDNDMTQAAVSWCLLRPATGSAAFWIFRTKKSTAISKKAIMTRICLPAVT